MVKHYKELLVWQKAVDLSETVYRVAAKFPKSQQYSLVQQLERSAISVASNIAEGASRQSTKEFMYFVGISIGSLAELETQLIIAQRLGFVEKKALEETMLTIDEIGKMLYGLLKKLKEKAND